ncbi:excinuclease ABC subunit UvrB [Carnobacteriaceae bacterium 52-44]
MEEAKFKLHSQYKPSGDQPTAIQDIVEGIQKGEKEITLLGATGTGKTFTMSNVIAEVNKPTLVIAHNKTLAGQLYSEFKEFFPENAVEYFVSYYDYYQPEAYVPSTDTFIEKDASINDEIDKLRHSATSSLVERRDTIVVASVSCIYGLVNPEDYKEHVKSLRVGIEMSRDELLHMLVDMQFERNDIDFQRGRFRVRGDTVEIFLPSRAEVTVRVEFFGDEIDRIREIDSLTGEILADLEYVAIFPATHFVSTDEQNRKAMDSIREELDEQLKVLRRENKLLEAQRLEQRTNYDLEMLLEMGYVSGIENYSRHLDGRKPGDPPYTLLDFFPPDALFVVDESHMTMPQIRGMYKGDRSRKEMLVEHGFRLPSALDNRPLTIEEFEERVPQITYISATPAEYERERSSRITEQIIRPTGLLDPLIDVRPIEGQIDDLIEEINIRVERNERVFITTLTKKMSEDLTDYFKEVGIKVEYLHSDVKTLERTEIIRNLRMGEFDVLIGINLLREGLDVPEVSLVAILDADKEGFLRNETSLIQTIGRAARNENGQVLMYADNITRSMRVAIDETERRRAIQEEYNEKHGITPKTIRKEVRDLISISTIVEDMDADFSIENISKLSQAEKRELVETLELEMRHAAKELEFEKAASIRDAMLELQANS